MRREVELKEKEVSHKLSQLQLEQGHAQLLHLRVSAQAEARAIGLSPLNAELFYDPAKMLTFNMARTSSAEERRKRGEEVERERARQLASAARHSQLCDALLTLESFANASENALAGVRSSVVSVFVRVPLPYVFSRGIKCPGDCRCLCLGRVINVPMLT